RNLVLSVASCFEGDVAPGTSDRTVTRLPLAYIAERQVSVYVPILYGSVNHLPEEVTTVQEATVEAQPTLLVGFPGQWTAAAGRVQVGVDHGGPVQRAAYALATRARRRHERALQQGGRISPLGRMASWAAYWTVCRQVLDKFGYPHVGAVLTAGAALPEAVAAQWAVWGLKLRSAYVVTEAAGLVALQRDGDDPGILRVLAGMEARLGPDGELLLRGPSLFSGYVGDPNGVDADGWFHTGDLAELEEGSSRVRIRGRRNDVITVGGRTLTASDVEERVRASPFIREAVVCEVAGGALGALVELDALACSSWARERGLTVAGYAGLAGAAPVRELIASELERVNEALLVAGLPSLADHRLFPQPLDPAAGDEVTATRAVKRSSITRKYRSLIDEMLSAARSEERTARSVAGVNPAAERSSR
ncbi:MAG: long-chain acyl-CoA synthetase, partial [Acidimicrobiia bacterium]|nr:long-chain acyl-CoA synthetase [Acidimicrobiia bacterium]